VSLPYHWDRLHQALPGAARFELGFDAPAEPGESYGIYLSQIGNAYRVWLNGSLLASAGDMGRAGGDDYAKEPRYFSVAPQLLQTHNRLTIDIRADGGRRAGLGAPVVGPATAVQPLYESARAWRTYGTLVVLCVSVLCGLFAAGMWLTQVAHRANQALPGQALPEVVAGLVAGGVPPAQQTAQTRELFGCIALASLLWAVRLSDLLTEQPPLAWPYWGVCLAVALSGAVLYMLLCAIHIANWRSHPWAQRFARAIPALLGLTAAVAVVSLWTASPWLLSGWYSVVNAVTGGFALWFLLKAWRGDAAHRWMALAVIVNWALPGYALWFYRFSPILGDHSWARYTSLLYALVMLYVAVTRFNAATQEARGLNHSLGQRVAQKEAELSASYAQVELLAREQERLAERTRILRDMHDGVGSHISSAIRQLQGGKASNSDVLQTLRDSLDQLKLSIDAMHLPPGDITALLANMRYRLEPRFASSGISFEWAVEDTPLIPRLDAGAMRQLQFMVFEALSNVLQHAHASVIRIEARHDLHGSNPTTTLSIIDNGQGFDTNTPVRRGLATMHERATAIGARLTITSEPGCTVLTCSFGS
jgi:signal transduction histidine kinase